LSAILFLYKHVLQEEIGMVELIRANKRRHRPNVLTREEVVEVLGRLQGTWWLMGMLLYGSGLRQIECLRLRVKDVDLKRGEVMVRDGRREGPDHDIVRGIGRTDGGASGAIAWSGRGGSKKSNAGCMAAGRI